MRIVSDLNGDYSNGVPGNLRLERFSKENDFEILFYGYNSGENDELQKRYENYNRKVLLNLWSPCDYQNKGDSKGNDALNQFRFFDEVYSICPYTIEWLKSYFNDTKHKYIFHPFDEKPEKFIENYEKKVDVCYFGGIHGYFHREMVDVIKKFNHRILSIQEHPSVTHYNIEHNFKFKLIAECKINVCFNLLPVTEQHIFYIKQYPNWDKNQANMYIENGVVPQYKCRVAESAFCKTLNLVQRDPWNVVEHYFVPDEEFIYFDDFKDLEEKIRYISKNFSEYDNVIENAYKRSLNYTGKPLVELIRLDKEWL